MKFTEGMWQLPQGIEHKYIQNVGKTTIHEDSIRLLGTQHLRGRGDTLNSTTMTFDVTTPLEGVIAIKATHWKGKVEKGPDFSINRSDVRAKIQNYDGIVTLASGDLKAVFNTQPNAFAVDFLDEQDARITGHGFRAISYVRDVREEPYADSIYRRHKGFMSIGLDIDVHEKIYGFGEKFGPFVKNGSTQTVFNEDGGTSSEMGYKNIPLFISSKGFGLFVNHSGRIEYEVQSERTTRTNIVVEDEVVEYMVIRGKTPKDILDRYTQLTGRPPIPPSWAYNLWLTTSFTTDYDEKTVNGFLDGFKERDIPLGVFHFDCFWMKGFEWCNFEFDADMFPDPKGQIKRLKERDMHACVWINSYIGQESSLFDEGKEHGYFILNSADDSVWQTELWQAGMAIVDFTNPEATEWYKNKLRHLVDEYGITSFKTDFGERIPFKGIKYHNGADLVRMHNYYTFLYNKAVHEVLEEKLGKGKGLLFARSATTGGQQFPVHWGGDCESTFVAMAETLRGGLSLGLAGFGFWAHDIGGFEGLPAPEVYKRWVQFGLLSSHSRLHGSGSYRVPWIYDDEACLVLKKFTELKISLAPYLFACAAEAHARGTPVLRAMLLEFPEDRASWTLDTQYMLGSNLLVAPIFNAEGTAVFYVPDEGSGLPWVSLLTGKEYAPGWYNEKFNFMTLPVLMRPNSAIPMNKQIKKPEHDFKDGLEVCCGRIDKAFEQAIFDGESKEIGKITISAEGKSTVFL